MNNMIRRCRRGSPLHVNPYQPPYCVKHTCSLRKKAPARCVAVASVRSGVISRNNWSSSARTAGKKSTTISRRTPCAESRWGEKLAVHRVRCRRRACCAPVLADRHVQTQRRRAGGVAALRHRTYPGLAGESNARSVALESGSHLILSVNTVQM